MKIQRIVLVVVVLCVFLLPEIAQAAGFFGWWPRRPIRSVPELSLGGAATGLALALGSLLVLSSRRRRRQ